MANIIFTESPVDSQKSFYFGRPESLFKDGAEFSITGYKIGSYTVDGKETERSATSQAVLLTTDLGEDLSLNTVLKGRKVVYDDLGKALVVPRSTFQAELQAHLLTLGRRDDSPELLKGTAEDAAKKAVEFFKDKKVYCIGKSFFAKDKDGKLVPGNITIQFSIR